MKKAQLQLQSGDIFTGFLPQWVNQSVQAEIVFNTGMVGYVEAVTDPSYAGQALCFTYPLIGNYGVPGSEDWESNKMHVSAVIISQLMDNTNHRDAHADFESWCQKQNIPILFGVDTRALARTLAQHGVVSGVIYQQNQPVKFTTPTPTHWVAHVSAKKPTIEKDTGEKCLIVVDCGIKANILRLLKTFDWKIIRVPYNYDLSHTDYDAILLSNGPGDPKQCHETCVITQKLLKGEKPIMGICLGHQLMALAAGGTTYKLPFGHRGQNHPCLEIATQRCFLTAQNHGYAVDEASLPNDWLVNFRHLNDQTVQGIEHKTKPFFSVQFHPEASPGPVDTHDLFQRFYDRVQAQ